MSEEITCERELSTNFLLKVSKFQKFKDFKI